MSESVTTDNRPIAAFAGSSGNIAGPLISARASVHDSAAIGPGSIVGPGVTIERGVTIGAWTHCMAKVTIGSFAVVAEHSVVTNDVPPHALMAGNPAKRIGWVGKDGRALRESGSGWWVHELGHEHYLELDGYLLEDD